MAFDTLRDLMVDGLKVLYSAETQLVRALPAMEVAAQSQRLKALFSEHLEETKVHVARLEAVLEEMHESARGKRCRAMEGLLEEGAAVANDGGALVVRDAGLIAAAQRVAHYEIAAYGSAIAFARQLEYHAIASVLQETIEEERAANGQLALLADTEVNLAAKLLYGSREQPFSVKAVSDDSSGIVAVAFVTLQ